jgi:superfamily I DNA/RNA helicase
MTSPKEWIPADGLTLEPNAQKAVRNITQNCVLTAGPGAGKTEMLAQRADFLLRTASCPYPRRILAISFKGDAARNLKDRVERRCGYQLSARFDSHTFHAFAKRLIDRYRLSLTGVDALEAHYTVGKVRLQGTQITFDDMVPLALTILENSKAARGALSQTYSHLFLDEFQDCNWNQYSLIKNAFQETNTIITAVGDTKQSIMGFAGALEGIFQQFAFDFDAQPLNLYQNHRAKPQLRRMQNRMIAVMDPKGALPPEEIPGEEGDVMVSKFHSDQEEAENISDLVRDWLVAGVPPREIAILVTKQVNLYAAPLMAALRKRGIPYRDEQTKQDLLAEPAATLILDFLGVIFDERQPEAYQRLMRVAVSSAADDEAESRTRSALSRYIRDSRQKVRDPHFDALDPLELGKITFGFTKLLGREAVSALSPSYQQGSRLDDVIKDTMSAVHEQIAVDNNPVAALRRLSGTDAIRILTIHKCKGLEFSNVVMLAVEEESFWGSLKDKRSAYFVGISRAKELLALTVADVRTRPSGYTKPWTTFRTPHDEFLSYAIE